MRRLTSWLKRFRKDDACPATTLTVPDSPKMLRETFCVAQSAIGLLGDSRVAEHRARLGRLADECDRHRPIGPDGKHGNRHTSTCGCDSPDLTDTPPPKED